MAAVADVWTRLSALPPVPTPPGIRAAVLVPLFDDAAGETRMILTKRPDHMRTHAGDMVFPGGRLEAGEGPVEAALRESWEEIALPPAAVEVIGGLEPVTTRDQANVIVPVVARIDRDVDLVPDDREVELIIEPTIAELIDEGRWVQDDFVGHPLWFYEFPEGILWGATAFMVRDLLDYLR